MTKMTSEKIATAARMYERMATYEDIADVMGVSLSCVINALKKHGVKSRSRGTQPKLSPQTIKKAVRLYEKGMSSYKVADAVGVSQKTVLRHLNRSGVDTSRGQSRATRISRSMLSVRI